MNMNEYAFSSSSSFDNLAKLDTKGVETIDDNIIQARNETINNLRSQLNDVMEKLKEMDNITSENQKLRQEKLEMESKYNSLNDRFQICLKINENNKKDLQRLTKEKEDFEIKMKQNEMSRTNFEQKANQEKKELEEELERAHSNGNEFYKKQISQLNENISSLLSVSSQVFNQNFQTLDSLRLFIQNFNEDSMVMPKDKKNQFSTSNSIMSAPQDEDYLQVINKLKQKNHKNKVIQKNLQNEISDLQEELQNLQKKSDNLLTDLQNKHNDELTNNKVMQMSMQSKISDLEKENQRLQDKLKKKNEQFAAMNSVTPAVTTIEPNDIPNEVDSLKQNIDNLQDELKNAKKKNSKLKKQIASLVDELKRDEECHNQLKNQIEKLASQNEEASETNSNQTKLNEKLTQENETLKKQNQQLTNERDGVNQNYKKLKSEANAIQNDLSQAKISVADLEALVNQYKNENADLLAAKNSISDMLNKQNKELAQKGEKILKTEEELKVLQFKLKTLENSMHNEDQQNVQIPKVTWFCSELPRDLCSEIIGIGKNENLPLQDKLKNVLSISANYIKNILDDNQKNLLKYEKERSKLNEILKRIVSLINSQIADPKTQLPMDQLVNDNLAYENGNKIFDLIESRFDELQNLHLTSDDEKKLLEDYLSRLIDVIGADSYESALDKANNIQNLINAYETKLKSLQSQKKEIKSDYNDLLNQYKSLKNKVSQVLAEKEEKIEQLMNEIEAISNDRDLSKKKIDELQNEIQKVNEEQQETLSTIELEQQQRSAELCQTLQRDFSAKLHQKENEVESLKQNAQKLTAKIARLKKKNETFAQKVQTLEAELSNIEDCKNEVRKEEKQKHKEELKNTVSQLNAVIENDKLEIESKNQEIQKYANKVSKAKTAFISLKEKCLKLEKENKISKAQLEASKIDNERMKNFCDAKIKASATLNENNYKVELGKINAEKESRIQELYHFIVETFSNFYDPREQLDSASVKSLLMAVRNKLESYTSQDAVIRQTLNASSNEDVEEMIRSLVPTKL